MFAPHAKISQGDPARLAAVLIDSPSKMAPTAAFAHFRDRTLVPMMQMHPDDPDLPKFLECVEAVLAWRAPIAPGNRFWRSDA